MTPELPCCGVCNAPILVGDTIFTLGVGEVLALDPKRTGPESYEDDCGDNVIEVCSRPCLMTAIGMRVPPTCARCKKPVGGKNPRPCSAKGKPHE